MSFPFRDRPSLRERLKGFGRAGDEIMEELKQSLDEDRKNFFDSNSKFSRTPGAFSRGFPFDDDVMHGKSKLKDHLDDIAKRHPEIADQLRDWAEVEKSPKIARGNSQEGPNVVRQESTEYRHKAAPQPQGSGEGVDLGQGPSKVHNLRSTVPDMQAQQEKMDSQRNQRSQSAPPESVPAKGPASTFDPNTSQQGPVNFNSQQTHNQSRDQTNDQSHPQGQARSNERYIPIFVEDRGETIVNVPNEKGTQGPTSPLRRKKSFPTAQSSGFQQSGQQQQPPSKPVPQPQPMPAPQTSSPAPATSPATQNQDPSETDSSSQIPPPPPPRPPSPLTLVANIQKEVDELKQRVDAFKGGKADKEYIYLDEMLTRNLLKLDNIDSEGKEEVRAARKEVIKLIQQCINHLESSNLSKPVNP